MAFPVQIIGRDNEVAIVDKSGHLAIGPAQFDEAVFQTLDSLSTSYNFFPPLPHSRFVMTSLIVFADKDVLDSSDTTVTIYEGTTADTTTVSKTLLQFGMGRLTSLPIVPLRLAVTEGFYVNAKTTDDDIHITMMGHYVKI